MVSSADDAGGLFVADNTHCVEEGSIEVCGRLGVDAIALHTTRRMHVVAIVVVDSYVSYLTGGGIAKEKKVACLA